MLHMFCTLSLFVFFGEMEIGRYKGRNNQKRCERERESIMIGRRS